MARRTNATGYDPHSSDPGNPWRDATWRSSGASTNANVIEIQSQTFRIDDRLATRERGVACQPDEVATMQGPVSTRDAAP